MSKHPELIQFLTGKEISWMSFPLPSKGENKLLVEQERGLVSEIEERESRIKFSLNGKTFIIQVNPLTRIENGILVIANYPKTRQRRNPEWTYMFSAEEKPFDKMKTILRKEF